MKRTDIKVLPPFYDRYINLVEDIDVLKALEKYEDIMDEQSLATCQMIGDETYAPNKWTIRELFQHIIDTERIMAYRALRFARKDKTPLPGFDENKYGDEMKANRKSIATLASEFNLLRRANVMLFKEFNFKELKRSGEASGTQISVLALGFTMVGHHKHHVDVIKKKYFSLLE